MLGRVVCRKEAHRCLAWHRRPATAVLRRDANPSHAHVAAMHPPCVQGPEAVKKAVLDTWAQFMDCPEVATEALNFIAVDWPAQPWTGGSYTGARQGTALLLREREQGRAEASGGGIRGSAEGEANEAGGPTMVGVPAPLPAPHALALAPSPCSLHDAGSLDLPERCILQALRAHPLVRRSC